MLIFMIMIHNRFSEEQSRNCTLCSFIGLYNIQVNVSDRIPNFKPTLFHQFVTEWRMH